MEPAALRGGEHPGPEKRCFTVCSFGFRLHLNQFKYENISQLAYIGRHKNLGLSAETDQFVYIIHENEVNMKLGFCKGHK